MGAIIDGLALSAELRADTARRGRLLKQRKGITPGLAVVLVGEDPASRIYVRNKARQTAEAGFLSFEHRLEAATPEAELLKLVERLNSDKAVHGILVQLPLPSHINTAGVLEAVAPHKDVDGFHPHNTGRLWSGLDGMVPCTPLGCLIMLKKTLKDLSGCEAVIIGRSNIVGKPIAALLLRENATVTIAHSKSRELATVCRRADIVVAAAGRPRMVGGDWVKPGACVLDIGINRIEDNGKTRLVGDVDFDAVLGHAAHITPVPGGVGPMTIACLLLNAFSAACRQNGLDPDAIG